MILDGAIPALAQRCAISHEHGAHGYLAFRLCAVRQRESVPHPGEIVLRLGCGFFGSRRLCRGMVGIVHVHQSCGQQPAGAMIAGPAVACKLVASFPLCRLQSSHADALQQAFCRSRPTQIGRIAALDAGCR